MQTSPTKQNICQLVHGLPVGGAEVLVTRMVRRLNDRYRFVVACLDEVGQLGEMLVEEGFQVVSLGRRPGFDWQCVRQLRRFVAAQNIELIHAHQYTPFAYALATRFFGRRPPVLFTEHGRFFPDYPSRKRKWFNRLLTQPRDRFVAVGNSVRQALIDNEGLRPERVEVVYNGVDLSSGKNNAAERATIRAQLGVADNEFMILQVARLDPIKDHNTAVRAMAVAARRNPQIRLFIVGDGPQKAAIEQEIKNESIDGRITMLGLRNDVPRLLAAADAFLLTSLSEGIPVTILEAMKMGVPVVATNVGGLPELVSDGVTGLLATAGDTLKLADAVERLVQNPSLRYDLAMRAKRQVEADFSERKMIASYDRIYHLMLSPRPASATKPIAAVN